MTPSDLPESDHAYGPRVHLWGDAWTASALARVEPESQRRHRRIAEHVARGGYRV